MAISRAIVETVSDARLELGSSRSRPAWLEGSHHLPFTHLSDDEFEIFCYLLLKLENPDDKIYYYGKTRDSGRDIIWEKMDGTHALIQCKRFSSNVDAGKIKAELAKLAANIHIGVLKNPPDEVLWYVVPDLTGPAADLLEDQATWTADVEEALKRHLKDDPTPELLEFALSWWPPFDREHQLSLTQRAKKQPELLEEFFGIKKVIDASLEDVRQVVREVIAPDRTSLASNVVTATEHVDEADLLDENSILSAFAIASEFLLAWPTTLGDSVWLERSALSEISNTIDTTNSSTTLLLGSPGSGKSALLARLGAEQQALGRNILAIKADTLDVAVDSEAKLAERLHLPAGVKECIGNISAKNKTIVLVDQLDVLGDLVDLRSQRLNVLLDLIKSLSGIEDVHVVASCREFDHQHDTRLASIEAMPVTLELPSWEEIAAVLKGKAIDGANWSPRFRESLRTPQHLKVFLERLQGTSETKIFESYQDMLDDLWDNRVLDGDEGSRRASVLMKLAEKMATAEELWIPLAQLDDQRSVVDQLIAQGVLMLHQSGRRIGFQHQTLFAYVRARAFAAGGGNFTQYVVDRQNGLFVRPTVWSSLKYMREANPSQYQQEINSLANAGLRPHLQHLLIDFLGQVEEPTEAEQMVLQRWLDEEQYRARAVIAIAGNRGWFARLSRTHLPAWMKLPIEKSWPIVHLIRRSFAFARDECLALLRAHWLNDASYDELTFSALQDITVWDSESVQDACKVIKRCEMHDYYPMLLATTISATSPELAPLVVAAVLNKKLAVADAENDPAPEPLPDNATEQDRIVQTMTYRPKARYEDLIRHSSEYYELPSIAEAAPAEFLQAVWPWFLSIVKQLLWEPHHVILRYREDHSLALELEGDSFANSHIMVAIESAVRLLARNTPAEFDAFLEQHKDFDALVVQILLCRGVAVRASTSPDIGIDFLTADPRRLFLGGHEDKHSESRHLLQVLGKTATNAAIRSLETAIEHWTGYVAEPANNDPETRFLRSKWDRESRLRLFNSLPFDRLSDNTKALINSERVALPDYREFDHKHEPMRFVGSPMSTDQMSRATDDHIVKLFDDLAEADPNDAARDFRRGGIEEASSAFGKLASTSPERVAAMLPKLVPEKHQKPAAYAIRNLGDTDVASAELFRLIQDLDERGFTSSEFRGEAAHALSTRAGQEEGLPADICKLLETWLEQWTEFSYFYDDREVDSSEEDRSILWQLSGGGVLPPGTYWLLLALTYGYLRLAKPDYTSWMACLERHLQRPESIYAWKVLCSDLRHLVHADDKPRAERLLVTLFERYGRVLNSNFGVHTIAKCRWLFQSETYRKLLKSYLDGAWDRGPQAFGELLGISYLFDEFQDWISEEVERTLNEGNPSHADSGERIGLAFAAANLFQDTIGRGKVADLFVRLSNTEDSRIATALMSLFVKSDTLLAHDDTKRLLASIVANPILVREAAHTWFAENLEDVVSYCPELVHQVCDIYVSVAESDLSDIRTAFSRAAPHLVNIALTLQRLGDKYREQGLSLFERLLTLGVADAQTLLTDLDCRPVNVPSRPPRRRRRRNRRT